jgi:hypothetical protein
MTSTTLPKQTPRTKALAGSGYSLHALSVALHQVLAALKAAVKRPVRAPEVSSAAEEANKVRRLADSYRKSDPRFAEDLYAAANRHEVIHGS